MTERDALYAAICADPEDTTLRLAYADWLDEQPTTKPCKECCGTGLERPDSEYCGKCLGAGTAPYTADADRAEFIRHQIATTTALFSERHRKREAELISAHPEWSHCPCPECIAGIVETGSLGTESRTGLCPTCGGTGDLFWQRTHVEASTAQNHRTVAFRDGFPDSVTCRLEEVIKPDGTPTLWASAVVRHTPVTRFVVTDVTAVENTGRQGGRTFDLFDASQVNLRPGHSVPHAVFLEMQPFGDQDADTDCYLEFPSPEDGEDVLARAAGRLVRNHVYGKAVKT